MTSHHPYLRAGHRRVARSVTAMSIGAAMALPLPACGGPSLSAPCAIVVDGSGSGSYFNVTRSLDSTAVRFMTEQKCGWVVFVPLNGVSEGSVCREKPLQIQPPDADPEQIPPARRTEAVKRAKHLLECARQSDGSDVFGALRRTVRQRPDGDGTYSVLMVTDMVHSAENISLATNDLRTPAARQKVISALRPSIPTMSGLALFPTDLSRGTSNPTLTRNISTFWHEILATSTAGNPRLDERYGQ
jgi:hypothetical protein